MALVAKDPRFPAKPLQSRGQAAVHDLECAQSLGGALPREIDGTHAAKPQGAKDLKAVEIGSRPSFWPRGCVGPQKAVKLAPPDANPPF